MKKTSRIASAIAVIVSFSAPIIVLAQSGINTGYLEVYSHDISEVINGILVPLLLSVSFIVFLWGIYKHFFWKGDSDTEREAGRTLIMYGIIGFVIIFCIWGIVELFKGTLGLDYDKTPKPPTFNITGS